MTANNALMQRLADLTGIEVVRPVQSEATAWGAAFLAGLGAGIFASLEDGRRLWAQDRSFTPDIAAGARDAGRAAWRTAVERVRTR